MRFSRVVLSSILLLSPVEAWGEFVPGSVFIESCHSELPDRQAACVAYIAGVVDSYLRSGQFCLPPNITPREISGFVQDYGTRVAFKEQTALNMIMLALKAKWPCGPRMAVNPGPRMAGPRMTINPGPGPKVVFKFNFNGFNF